MGRTLDEVINSLPKYRQDKIAKLAEEYILKNKLYEQFPELLEDVSPEVREKLQSTSSLNSKRSI